MDIIEFYRHEQKRLHKEMRAAVSDLTLREWNTLPDGTGNTIAFLFWHSVRTEDNILRFILQKRPPIWNENGWAEKLHLPAREQGTGMDRDIARAFILNDSERFLVYAEEVWQAFETYLAEINDGGAELSTRIVTIKPLGQLPAILAIGQVCLSHLFMHLGEIAALRGALDKQGMPL